MVGKEVKEAKHELGSCRYQQQSDFQYYPIQIKCMEKNDMANLLENGTKFIPISCELKQLKIKPK